VRFVRALGFGIGMALAWVGAATAAVTETQSFPAVKAASPPPLDAALADPVWQTALQAQNFTNFTDQAPAKLPTTAYLLYDDKNLYVGFVAEQPGVPITATQGVNDVGLGLDDSVTIGIDPSGSGARTYAFTVTPRGVRYETSSESSRYQPLWAAVATRTQAGYRVMMVIPLTDMRLSGAREQSWRVDFTRRVAATGDLYTWAYDPASNAYCSNNSVSTTTYCDSTRWPLVTGIAVAGAAARPRPYADVYALGSGGSDHNVFETTPGSFTTQPARPIGLDATVPLTTTLSFVGTLNPDFSNVEADQTVIAPQEFPRNYTEYRPFFAQGFNYIDALPHVNVNGPGNVIFYSPALGIVNSGFKIEGTSGQNAIGALDATGDGFDDQAVGYGNARPDGSLSFSLEAVDAHHPGISDQTWGVGGAYANLHSGLQPLFIFEQERGTLVSAASLAQTITPGIILQHGPILIGVLWRDVGPEFAPIDGYNRINDIDGPQAVVAYNGVGGKGSAIKSYSLTAIGDRYVDRSGAVHEADVLGSAGVTLKSLLSLTVSGGASELRSYADAYPAYTDPEENPFNQTGIAIGYKDGTPSPTDFSYSFGPFGVYCPGSAPQPLLCNGETQTYAPAFVQQLDVSTTRQIGHGYGLALEFGGTLEHGIDDPSDSQWLRRLSLTRSFGSEGQLAIGLRSISGTGGFAAPGVNLAVSYHQRLANQSQLYLEYGTPAAIATLHRFIVKYVLHVGGAAGT
jgi:hypothetical protein